MSWKKLLESVSESLNNHIQLRNDYLMAENRILRNQIDGRVQLTDRERKEFAELGAQLGKKALEEIATVAQPDTILAWNRKFANEKVDTSEPPQSVGRPRVDQAIEDLVLRMARENRSWGYDRIQGALNHLGYTISDQTVGNILKRHSISPAPERKKTVTWREFVRCHWDVLRATDFFTSDVWNWFGLIVSSLLRFIHVGRHHFSSVRMTLHPQMPGMHSFLMTSLELRAHAQRWSCWVKTFARSQTIRGGAGLLERTGSEFAPSDERPPRSQERAKVVVLSDASPKPIRDGPRRRQPRRDRKLPGYSCQAA